MSNAQHELRTRFEVAAAARHLYERAPQPARLLQGLRPFICSFEDLVRWAPERGQVLDIGCGAGLFLGLIGLARPHVSGIGFDADGKAISAAQVMAQNHFPDGRIRFEHKLVGESLPEGPFEFVSMVDVLHHVPSAEQRNAIEHAFEQVSPGGMFIYKDMAHRPFYRAWWNRLHDILLAQQWIHYRPIVEVEDWLRSKGAQTIARSSRNIGLYGHELLVVKRLT